MSSEFSEALKKEDDLFETPSKIDDAVSQTTLKEGATEEKEYPLHKFNVSTFMTLIVLGGFHIGFSIGSAN